MLKQYWELLIKIYAEKVNGFEISMYIDAIKYTGLSIGLLAIFFGLLSLFVIIPVIVYRKVVVSASIGSQINGNILEISLNDRAKMNRKYHFRIAVYWVCFVLFCIPFAIPTVLFLANYILGI